MEAKGITVGLRGNCMDLKEIFYSNLLLLGFDAEAQEAKYRVPFNSDMFLYPNKKAMEVVLHFLFCNLNASLALQEFRDCWPVQDKKMEQQFRKSCNSWLTKISKEEPDSNLPRIGPSLFLSPGGDRFYEVLFYFSSYVLRKVMMQEYTHGNESAVPHMCKKITRMPNMNNICCKAMLIKMLAEKNRFFENVQHDLEVQEHWKSYAMSSTKEYRKLCKENRELERKLNQKNKVHYVEETEALLRTKQLQEVRDYWSTLQMFYKNTQEKRAIINEILENTEPNFHLDGSTIEIKVPDALTTKYRHAIQMKNIKNTYEEGKLNVLSLVQLSTLSLIELKEKMKQDGVPHFEQFIPYVKHETRAHGSYLVQAQNLRGLLKNKLIPALKKSIDQLKEECYDILDETVYSPVISLESSDFGLGLVPATPSSVFNTSCHLSASKIPEISLKKTPGSEATPDVVQNLTSSIREMVVTGNQQPGEKPLPSEENAVRTKEIPKPFVSKIPKPVNSRLSRTPDLSSDKSTAVRRRSLTTAKKKIRNDGMESARSKKELACRLGTTASKDVAQRKKVDEDKLDITSDTGGHFRTPLAKNRKSNFMKQQSSARNILAERIAEAVFPNGSSCEEASLSVEENSPQDMAVTDPLGSLMDEAFKSKDLIPRTPFRDDFCVLESDDVPADSKIKNIRSSMNSHDENMRKNQSSNGVPLQESSLFRDDTMFTISRTSHFESPTQQSTSVNKDTHIPKITSNSSCYQGLLNSATGPQSITTTRNMSSNNFSPDIQSSSTDMDKMLTPFMNGDLEILRPPRLVDNLTTDGVISDIDDVMVDVTQATRVTYSNIFTTPMMSSMGNDPFEFGQTPLQDIAPPLDFNCNSIYRLNRESVRSRLSFDFITPISSKTTDEEQPYLSTENTGKIGNVKVEDEERQIEFSLLPINTDDLFQTDSTLPFQKPKEKIRDEEESRLLVKTTETSPDSTAHVKVGKLIDID